MKQWLAGLYELARRAQLSPLQLGSVPMALALLYCLDSFEQSVVRSTSPAILNLRGLLLERLGPEALLR